jgi:hypothetical protein
VTATTEEGKKERKRNIFSVPVPTRSDEECHLHSDAFHVCFPFCFTAPLQLLFWQGIG